MVMTWFNQHGPLSVSSLIGFNLLQLGFAFFNDGISISRLPFILQKPCQNNGPIRNTTNKNKYIIIIIIIQVFIYFLYINIIV